MLESGIMVKRYLDEIVPVNSGILGQYVSPVGPFREPMYAMVDNDTVAATPALTRTRSSKPKKKKSNKPKNDGIIRNHDSVWDYKIQDGKLLTKRKGNKNWIDISDNEVAVDRIQNFTGKSIGRRKPESNAEPVRTPAGGPFGGKTYDELNAYFENLPSPSPQIQQQASYIPDNRPIIAANVPSLEDILYGGAEFPNKRRSLKTTKSSNGAKTSSDIGKEFIAKNIRTAPIATNFLNRNIGDAIPLLGTSVYDQVWSNKIPIGPYLDIMQMLGINPMQDRINRYYPMI